MTYSIYIHGGLHHLNSRHPNEEEVMLTMADSSSKRMAAASLLGSR